MRYMGKGRSVSRRESGVGNVREVTETEACVHLIELNSSLSSREIET